MCRKMRRAGPMTSACALVCGAKGCVEGGVVDARAGLLVGRGGGEVRAAESAVRSA
jgi:hypothetical protein